MIGRRKELIRDRHRAFTLVELLVVVAILCLLLGILVPTLRRAKSLAVRTQCAINERQWGQALAAYAASNQMMFPYNGRVVSGVPWPGFHISWNSSVLQQFWKDFLLPNTASSKTDEHDVLNCPTQKWHQVNDTNLGGGLVGYFYMPSRDPKEPNYNVPANINYAASGVADDVGWVTKARFGGPYAKFPIMSDMKQYGTFNGSWFSTPAIPFSSHIRTDGQPEGGNFLFEDGRVVWYQNEQIGLSLTMNGWMCFYKIPL